MEYQIKNKKKGSLGFTLIETMIAIAILVLAILGPLTIAANALHSAYFASDQVTAFYLAQEGIEYMRFLRDNDFIADQSSPGSVVWDQGLEKCDSKRGGYTFCGMDANNVFSSKTTVLINCDNLAACRLVQDSTGAFHQLDSGGSLPPSGFTQTNFYRTITVSQVPGTSNEDKITAHVSWTTGNLSSPTNFEISENVFNWLGSSQSPQ